MAEVDILMQEKQDDGSYNKLYPITNASNVNYTNSALAGVSNAQQGLDSIVNTLGDINLNNYFTKTQTLTSTTAALFGLGTDAVPDDVLALLSKAALYKGVTSDVHLADLPVGSIFTVEEDGKSTEFFIACHDYEERLNGKGRTLIVRKNLLDSRVWDAGNVNNFSKSDIFNWLNGTYKNKLGAEILSQIGTVKIKSRKTGSSDATDLSCSVFLLSTSEVSGSSGKDGGEGIGLPIGNMLAQATDDIGQKRGWWTRSPNSRQEAYIYNFAGSQQVMYCDNPWYIRPSFTLPGDMVVSTKTQAGIYDVNNSLIIPLPTVQIATGSYVGTGKYGEDNPNSLTFEFAPKLLFITNQRISGEFYGSASIDGNPMDCSILTTNYTIGLGFASESESNILSGYAKKSFDGKTITWYHRRSSSSQQNESGYVYYYLAIG